MRTRFAVLLAGGRGTRLAPLSSRQFPKQFFRLPGEDESLLQQAARTACSLVPAGQIITVTTAEYAPLVKQQLREIDADMAQHVLVEPGGYGTAVSCAVAAHYVSKLTEKGLLWVMPCDHDRRLPLSFAAMRERGFAFAEEGHMLAFGVRPHAPDTGFGYMLADNDEVLHFHEKPDLLRAQELLDSGRAWWNSGMFVMPASKILGYLRHLAPELHDAAGEAVQRAETHSRMLWLCADTLRDVPPQSIDVAVMERVNGLKMLPIDEGWSDIGTWPRLLAWWQTHAAHIPSWDFGNGESLCYAEAWEKMKQS